MAAGFAIWAGLIAAIVCQTLWTDYAKVRLDLFLCLLLIALGFWFREATDRVICAHLAVLPAVPRPAQPRGFKIMDASWPIAYHSHIQFVFWFTCFAAVPVMLGVHGPGATPLDVAVSPEVHTEAGLGAVPLVAAWAGILGHRALKDHRRATKKIDQALNSGAGHALPIIVSDRFGGVPSSPSRGHEEADALLVKSHAEYAAAEPALSPYKSGALCLLSENGERSLFLDRRADPLVVSDVLAGREGWLYWHPANEPMARVSVPAVLVLGDGRYIRGWTQDNGQTAVPDGEAITVRPGFRQMADPIETSVLRARTTCRPALYYFAVAIALLSSSFLGLWNGEAKGVPLLGGAALIAIGLSVGRLVVT
ncbi:hypothetical protein GL263_25425, partial [Streptomyces durbertensis]